MNTGTADHGDPAAESRSTRWSRVRLFHIGWAITVIPVWIAAWRVAASGFYPTGDAGLTVLRSHDVLTAHPPLVGMPAASGSVAGALTYFPGPLQLYALAVPVEVFGNVWGPPIAMAALTTVWITLAAWVLRRSLGPLQALGGLALMAVFAWSIGIGYLVDPVPILMMLFGLVPLLLVVTCTISGDPVALVATAIIGNFLWLDHLVFVVAVPILVGCGLIGYVWAHWGEWRNRSEAARVGRRRAWRGLVVTAAVSLVMWLPTLIAEVTRSPGNLHLLFSNVGADRESVASWQFAFHVVVDLIAWPPFWLRGSFWDAPFVNQPGPVEFAGAPAAYDVVAALVLAALFIALGVAARRDGDRLGVWALVVAVVAMVAAVPTIYFTPTKFGVAGYLRPLWGVAAFVWFAIAFVAVRLVLRRPFGQRLRTPAVWSVAAVIAVFGALNVPTGQHGYVPDRDLSTRVDTMNRQVLAHLAHVGPVQVRTRPDYSTQAYFGALILALKTAGIDFCVGAGSPPVAGVDACDNRHRHLITIAALDDPPADTSNVVVSLSMMAQEDQRRLDELDSAVAAWLDGPSPPELSPAVRRASDTILDPAARAELKRLLEFSDPSRPLDERMHSLSVLVGLWFAASQFRGIDPFVSSPLTNEELREWQRLGGRAQTLVVTDDGPSTR